MPKKKAARQAKVNKKPASKTTNAPPPPNSVDEASGDEAERAFWWTVHERRDFLKEKIREWECNDTNDLATKEHRLAQLHTLLDEVEELLDDASVDPEPKDLSRLKHWHSGLTQKQRESWAHSMEQFPRPSRRHHFLSPVIQRAIAETNGSTSDVYIWLREKALNETAPLTGIDNDGAILYASGKNKQKSLTRNALGKHLSNLRK